MQITIPKGNGDTEGPCWVPLTTTDGKSCKPIVRCKCGEFRNILNHHVHKDGMVTASFFCTSPLPNPCEWHVNLIFADYNGEEYPPGVDQVL
jgi:hypothetical protein